VLFVISTRFGISAKSWTRVPRLCLLLCCIARRGTTGSCHRQRLTVQAHSPASSLQVRTQHLANYLGAHVPCITDRSWDLLPANA
jgi:hypothetical protein